MHDHQMIVTPMPTSKKAHKLLMLCTVSMTLANHHTLPDVGIDAAFSKMSLRNPAVVSHSEADVVYESTRAASPAAQAAVGTGLGLGRLSVSPEGGGEFIVLHASGVSRVSIIAHSEADVPRGV